jgi:luciferase family oxidoreductase group 1
MTPLSVLDLTPVVQGGDVPRALREARAVAVHAEAHGYKRYWVAEHHNMPGVASAATAVVLAHVGAATSTIRVGAGGVMLPNHVPLVVAEQFGTLDALFPGRVDLGLGRAPGTDPLTARALRRHLAGDAEGFPDDVVELLGYFRPTESGAPVRAIPGEGAAVEVWILGSSLFGARLAGVLGLPFAFASHFAPAHLMRALEVYRAVFRPSERLARPHVMAGVNVIAADTDAEAELLLTSLQQVFVSLRRGRPGPLPPPQEGYGARLGLEDRATLADALACTFAGAPATVRRGLEGLVARTGADELIVSTHVYDHAARLRSIALTAGVRDAMAS